MRSDERKQEIRDPNFSRAQIFLKIYKDLIALFILIGSVLLLIFIRDLEKDIRTLLITLASGSAGFLFGKRM